MEYTANLHDVLVIDIETCPNTKAETIINERSFKPASNIKDPEKIQKNIEDQRRKAYSKAALNWPTARVTTICARALDGNRTVCFIDRDEKRLLSQFGNFLIEDGRSFRIVAKNIEFDRPMLIGRYLVHDLGIPECLRPCDIHRIDDIDRIFSNRSSCSQLSSLENYAIALGLGGKSGTGEQAPQLFLDWFMTGNEQARHDLVNYCMKDVDLTVEIYSRAIKPYTFDKRFSEEEIPF